MSTNRKVIGRCSCCQGTVSIPKVSQGVARPQGICDNCGATEDTCKNLPEIKMRPGDNGSKQFLQD